VCPQPVAFEDNTRLLQTSLARYFNQGPFSDITVIGPDGRKLLCHQLVLSAGSRRFANMLEQGGCGGGRSPLEVSLSVRVTRQQQQLAAVAHASPPLAAPTNTGNLQHEELPVWGVDSDALQAIIEFFYSGRCELSFPAAIAIMDAATRLDVPALATAADAYVRGALSINTVCTILSRAVQYKLHDLTAACLQLAADRCAHRRAVWVASRGRAAAAGACVGCVWPALRAKWSAHTTAHCR
jgi:hypothetical protein